MTPHRMRMTAFITVAATTGLLAGGWQNKTNASAEYIRGVNRNASQEADAAYYNPAGITSYRDGLFANVSNQFMFKKYSHEVNAAGTTYEDSKPVLLLPGLQLGYKRDNWAAFFTFNVPAGGGSVLYDEGTATTAGLVARFAQPFVPFGMTPTVNSQKVESSSAYYGLTLGGAYNIMDIVSLALGGRLVMARKSTSINADFYVSDGTGALNYAWDMQADFDEAANGFTGIVGINVTPLKNLNIAMKYEFVTRLGFTQSNVNDTARITVSPALAGVPQFAPYMPLLEATAHTAINGLATEDSTYDQDLPGFLAGGIAYRIIPQLEVNFGCNYYFNKQARWPGDLQDHIKNSWEVSGGIQADVLPILRLSAGYAHGNVGSNATYYGSAEDPSLDFNYVGGGATVKVTPGLLVTLGFSNAFYTEMKTADQALTLNKNVFAMGLGVAWFMGNKADE